LEGAPQIQRDLKGRQKKPELQSGKNEQPQKKIAKKNIGDIAERRRMEQAILLISDTQRQIAQLDNLTDIYTLVGKKIQELIGDGYVAISMLDEQIQAIKIVGLYGFGNIYKNLVSRFKMDPSKIVYPLKDMKEDELRLFRSGRLEKFEGGLYAILARKVPQPICDLAEKQLKITGIYTMGFVWQGDHFGGLTLLAKGDIVPYKDLIETIMNQAAISINRKRVEEALRESEKRYQTLAKISTVGIFRTDPQGQTTYVNPRWCQIAGMEADKALVNGWLAAVHPEDRQSLAAGWRHASQSKNKSVSEYRFLQSDGTVVWVMGQAVPERDAGGRVSGYVGTITDITEHKRAEEESLSRLNELEMLYAASLAVGQTLQPKEIGKKILDILADRLHWHHAAIHQYHPDNNSLELLAFNQVGLKDETERLKAEQHFKRLISKPGQGLVGWVLKHGQPVYSSDLSKDKRYIEVWPNVHSSMVVPLKAGKSTIGCLSVTSEELDAFTETDEWLITTLAMLAASALENARLFEETRQRLAESEAVNSISIALRAAENLESILPAFLDEALKLLNTPAGVIWLYDPGSDELLQSVSRDWFVQLPQMSNKPGQGLAGTTFASGEAQFSREFVRDPKVLETNRELIPSGWGGACVPIHSTQEVLGVMMVSVQLPRELTSGEIRVLSTLAEILGIAVHRMRLHEQTEHQLEHVRILHEIDTVIAASFDLSITLDIILQNVLKHLQVDAGSVLILNPHTHMLNLEAGKGFLRPGIEKHQLGLGEGYAGRAVRERHMIQCLDLPADNDPSPFYRNLMQGEGFISYLGVPLVVKGDVKGVLEIFQRSRLKPDDEWVNFLGILAGQAAIAIDSNLTYSDLQRSNLELEMTYDMTLEGWSRALDMRDKETEGHSIRVTEMTLRLGRLLGVRDVEEVHLRRGSLLHDMGKIGIPDAILLKPGPLTAEEWEVMRTHPVRAYEMLAPIPYLSKALEIPHCHHEKWDGSGYPRGLKGEEIPLSARIFAVVDVYDALTSDRPYRPAWTKEKALDHIREQTGKHFDPQVVEAFLSNIKDVVSE
jgi:PAS domain S-box-containing protein